MIELLKHVLGFCGDHWHPNVWTAAASSPLIASTAYYIKCKCGGLVQAQENMSTWKIKNIKG